MSTETAAEPRIMPTWLLATISGLFGLFYAYGVWNALDFLLSRADRLNALGWSVLLLAVLMPIIVFAATFALGNRRKPWELALLHLTGLGVVAVFWLNVLAYSYSSGTALVAG